MSKSKVLEIIMLLEKYQSQYFKNKNFRRINNCFEFNLFNTLRSYIDHSEF